ncbi:Hypothetical protein CINCED_3A005947 [Cinara cedri]|uniref:Uncharacterized protein n=1 Tax=Cinara cedri TaxID=506608 RepID=A0A5E4NHA7_9HEMI|nr:Hypothetical protein CINCED_3A005947 [Cinara cedri]
MRTIRDLRVLLSSDLSFNEHIDTVCAKPYRHLGLLNRNCDGFNNIHRLRTLYYASVRSGVEFRSVVWNPMRLGLTTEIEKVQRRFLRTIARKINSAGYPASVVERQYNTNSLQTRRIKFRFLYRLVSLN